MEKKTGELENDVRTTNDNHYYNAISGNLKIKISTYG